MIFLNSKKMEKMIFFFFIFDFIIKKFKKFKYY